MFASIHEAVKAVENQQASLLDVRTATEFAQGYARGAINFDVNKILDGQTPPIKPNTSIVLICRSGNRAETALSILANSGYNDIYNAGGLADWLAAGGQLAD